MGNEQQKTLVLLRGVQGSGKTSLARTITSFVDTKNKIMFAADDFFYQADGSYVFDIDKLHTAHKVCFEATVQTLDLGEPLVVVHNTFSRVAELTPYIKAAEERGYKTSVVVVENRHGSTDVHKVPQEMREEFAQRIKSNIKLI